MIVMMVTIMMVMTMMLMTMMVMMMMILMTFVLLLMADQIWPTCFELRPGEEMALRVTFVPTDVGTHSESRHPRQPVSQPLTDNDRN
jgi:hypothetical protein